MFYIFPVLFSSLFTDKKSSPKKIPVTPLIERIFLIKSLLISSLLVISIDPLFETRFTWNKF